MPGPIAKPVMRGLLLTWTKKQMFFLLTGCTGVGVGYYFLVGQRRKKAYADFYKTYDDEKQFNALVKLGVYNCINAKGEINKEVFE